MQHWVKDGLHWPGNPQAGKTGNFMAICCSNTTLRVPAKGKGRCRRLPLLGQIHFYKGSLRMGIICHEAGHAALAYCDRMKIDVNEQPQRVGCASDGEEDFCYALGNIARQVVLRTQRKRLC